jgi:tetratricopeptide (TPR) repeat protein
MRERVPDNPMGPQGVGDVLWSSGRRDEAAAAYEEAIELYERFGAEQAWSRHGVGWCQHRIGHYAEAAQTYQLALPASDERSPLLFDIGLNLLASGEIMRAADAYAQGFGVLPAVPRTRVLGMLVAADEDLRVSVEAGIIEDSAQVADVRDRLAKERSATRPAVEHLDRLADPGDLGRGALEGHRLERRRAAPGGDRLGAGELA